MTTSKTVIYGQAGLTLTHEKCYQRFQNNAREVRLKDCYHRFRSYIGFGLPTANLRLPE